MIMMLILDKMANMIWAMASNWMMVTMVTMYLLLIETKVVAQLPVLPGQQFPVNIGGQDHMVQGRISADAQPGDLVPVDFVIEGQEELSNNVHLRVEIRQSVYVRPHVYHSKTKVNMSDPNSTAFEHPVMDFTNDTLPSGMFFVVLHTNAFTVNPQRFIVVNDFTGVAERHTERIAFEVVLKDTLSEIPYISNHLYFIVEVETSFFLHVGNSAISVGVLIFAIMAFSLIIPFVVRAKRRSKKGKPICCCGPEEDTNDLVSQARYTVTTPAIEVTNEDGRMVRVINGYAAHSPASSPNQSPRMRRADSTADFDSFRQFLTASLTRQHDKNDFVTYLGETHGHSYQVNKPHHGGNGHARNGTDNLAMVLDSGRLMHSSSINPHTTIQNAMMRSTTPIRFQQDWLDPQYENNFRRPEAQYYPRLAPPSYNGHAFQPLPKNEAYNDVRNERNATNQSAQSTRGSGKRTSSQPRANGNVRASQNDKHSNRGVTTGEGRVRRPNSLAVNGDVGRQNSPKREDRLATHLPITPNTVISRL